MEIQGRIASGLKNSVASPLKKAWHIFAVSCLMLCGISQDKSGTSREYQVKAVFLFNFTQFVEWPAKAFQEEQTPLVIGILGDDPFGTYLDQTVQGEKVNGHPLQVKRFRHTDDIGPCHILYVNLQKDEPLKQLLTGLKGSSTLTVGDAENFARHGGMVRFFKENNKIRIRINLEATKAADLTISSKLLRLAEIVDSKSNGQ